MPGKKKNATSDKPFVSRIPNGLDEKKNDENENKSNSDPNYGFFQNVAYPTKPSSIEAQTTDTDDADKQN